MTHNWLENYDPEIGLWWATRSPAHTAPLAHLGMKVHPGPDAVGRLILAADRGEISALPVERILSNVLKMHETGERGNLCWYWEDGEKSSDANASFFTGLGLIALSLGYPSDIPASCQDPLRAVFEGLATRFQEKAAEETFHCLNGYLGDVVCGWLLLEILECQKGRNDLAAHMVRAADCWLNDGFGFGEHLSDVYARVALQQLSLLLVFEKALPTPVRSLYRRLLDALLAIEDVFDGSPRVPAIRNYEFLTSPSRGKNKKVILGNYRDRICPLTEIEEKEIGNNPPLEGLLYRAGWQKLAGPRQAPVQNAEILCHGGATAHSWIAPDIRLGSLSHFPVMPEAEFKAWGMAWQSFPVVFWRSTGDWGYLQWEIGQKEETACYPSEGPSSNPHRRGNPLTNIMPPIVGESHAIQRGPDLLVLRMMPAIDQRWTTLAERFRLVDSTAEVEEIETREGWSQLLVRYPEREISIHHIQLMPNQPTPHLAQLKTDNRLDWECHYPTTSLNRRSISLWAISLEGRIETAPEFTPRPTDVGVPRFPEEQPLTLKWQWPHTTWSLHIDLLDPVPLRVVG